MANKQRPEEQEQDRHLSAPGEANRDKHINFVALENGDPDPSMEDDSPDAKEKRREGRETKDGRADENS